MSIQPVNRNEIFVMSPLEALVPDNHLVRKLDRFIDWSFIYELTDHLYTDKGRGRTDPVILFKMIFINKLFGINSMRKTCEEVKVNVAYRWFLGLSFEDKVPDHSTYSQNYRRKFKDSNIIEAIFSHIIQELIKENLIDFKSIFLDGTHIKANANKNKYTKETMIIESAKIYQKELDEEIQSNREQHGKKALKEKEVEVIEKICKVSKHDPESGVFHKGEKEKCFAYGANTACDKHGYILGTYVTAGNIHDSKSFYGIYEQLQSFVNGNNIKNIVADAGYITPHICKTIYSNGQLPILPYKRPMTKKGLYKKYEYVYDEEFDCYICPEGKILEYTTTNREGYEEYKSKASDCKNCKNLSKCTNGKEHRKVVTRHVWERHKEAAEHQRHVIGTKEIYAQRKETIERVFADAKSKHGMGYTRYTGKQRVTDDVLLIFAAMNMKKMVTYLSKIGVKPSIIRESIEMNLKYLHFISHYQHILKKS